MRNKGKEKQQRKNIGEGVSNVTFPYYLGIVKYVVQKVHLMVLSVCAISELTLLCQL